MTVSKEVIEILEYLCAKFGIVVDWTSENVFPYLHDLCEKFITWEIATSKLWLILGAILVVIGVVLWVSDSITGWGDYLIGYIFGGILVVIGIIMVVMQVYDIITCMHFPELKLYDYLKLKLGS